MAALTGFFVAREDELPEAFPGWVQDVPAAMPSMHVGRQPSGLLAQIRRFLRQSDEAPDVAHEPPRIDRFDHRCEFKGVDLAKLAGLMEVMGITSFEAAIDELDQPVLYSPRSEDEGLHRLPDRFTQALARLKADQIRSLATQWSQADDSGASDVGALSDVLACLHDLAEVAKKQNKQVYHWWSL